MKLSPFLPAQSAPLVFGFILSGLMTLLVSALSIIYTHGLGHKLLSVWMDAWLVSWLVAFPIVLVVAPIVRWVVHKITLPISQT